MDVCPFMNDSTFPKELQETESRKIPFMDIFQELSSFRKITFVVQHSGIRATKNAPEEISETFCSSRRLPIFTRRFQRTILGTSELNCCVRNGNRWNLTVIVTDHMTGLVYHKVYCLSSVFRRTCLQNWIITATSFFRWLLRVSSELWSSPRPISTRLLNGSLHLHIVPINLVVCKGSYLIESVGYLIFGSASRLDAFSVYPIRT